MMSSSSKIISLDASTHPVKAVTIFRSSIAQLTRTFTVDLESGSNVLEISGISSNIDEDSPRIHGLLGTGARIIDISCNTELLNVANQDQSKNVAKIKALKMKRALLDLEIKVRRTEYDLLDNVINYGRPSVPDKLTSLDSLMDAFVTRKRNAMKTVIEMKEEVKALDKERQTAAVVVVKLLATADCKVDLQLTYLVSNVSWMPFYDLHGALFDGKPSFDISLHYYANITQNTGEDWTDTILTLSTANPQALHSLTIPEIDPLHPSPQALSVPIQKASSVRRSSLCNQTAKEVPGIRKPVPTWMSTAPLIMQRLHESESESEEPINHTSDDKHKEEMPLESAVPDKNPVSLAYRVEGRVSLLSDGVAHKVPITVLDFSAALKYVCVPCKTSTVFIEGRIENTSDYELLAGPVSVFMDDSFVAKTSLEHIGVNESFTCVLGVDTSLKVSYQTKSHTKHEPARNFAEPSKATTHTVTTTITNKHSFDMTGLVVRDAIPLGNNDENIKVTLRQPQGLARAKDGEEITVVLPPSGADKSERQEVQVRWTQTEDGAGGEKDGLYEWVCGLKAGEKVRLEAQWDVKGPSKVQ